MELNLDSIVASFAQNNSGLNTSEETRGSENALAALEVHLAVEAATSAAAFDLAVAGSGAAAVEPPVAAPAGVVG